METPFTSGDRHRDVEQITGHVFRLFDAYLEGHRAALAAGRSEDWKGFQIRSTRLIRGVDSYLEELEAVPGSLRVERRVPRLRGRSPPRSRSRLLRGERLAHRRRRNRSGASARRVSTARWLVDTSWIQHLLGAHLGLTPGQIRGLAGKNGQSKSPGQRPMPS